VRIEHPVSVERITKSGDQWALETSQGGQITKHLVIATGGLPVPAIGATEYALDLARQFDIPVTAVRPALVPLSFTSTDFADLADLSGISLPVSIQAGHSGKRYGSCLFDEDLLLTHKGLSGPAVLQASSYWIEGETIELNWLGKQDFDSVFMADESRGKAVDALLAELLPQRLAKQIAERFAMSKRNWAEVSKADRQSLKEYLIHWSVKPAGTLGWKKAEVMVGV
jgi:predicted Rossmann fold flavoprotein